MKKLLTIILLAVFTLGTVEARKLIYFGPRVGMNFNFASGSDMLKPGNIGYNFGAFIEVRPIKLISVSMDVMYSREGYKVDFQPEGVNSSLNYDLGYLNIPILANLYIWKGLTIKAGIMPSIKVGGKVTFNGVEVDPSWNVMDNIKAGNFSIPVGIGYSFGLGLDIDLRYNIGVTENAQISRDSFAKSQVLQLTIGWKF